jgi:hypothetical protein
MSMSWEQYVDIFLAPSEMEQPYEMTDWDYELLEIEANPDITQRDIDIYLTEEEDMMESIKAAYMEAEHEK